MLSVVIPAGACCASRCGTSATTHAPLAITTVGACQVFLSVCTRYPPPSGRIEVTVVPVSNDQNLRTRAWVEENRRFVEKRSNGQLAYVYVPNTGQGGFDSFNRYYFAQQDKQGAVIDERRSTGGRRDVAADDLHVRIAFLDPRHPIEHALRVAM